MAKNIKIAYLISCYKLPEQVVRLVGRLQHSSDIFLIHIDKESPPEVSSRIESGLGGMNNVVFLPRHYANNWGGFGHVKATLKGIAYLESNNIEYTNFVVITGQDYPIRSTEETRKRIASAGNSMEYFELPTENWTAGGLTRVYDYHFWMLDKHYSIKLPWRKMYANRALRALNSVSQEPHFFGGSSYFQVERELARYISHIAESQPRVMRFFNHTYISDEVFFQTILLNSEFGISVTNASLRYIDWSDPKESPKIIRKYDLNKLVTSKAIFARKFDQAVDPTALSILDKGGR